jgi:hypothetical protein
MLLLLTCHLRRQQKYKLKMVRLEFLHLMDFNSSDDTFSYL